jgi:DNA-binding LytR/AlgR family response regulator
MRGSLGGIIEREFARRGCRCEIAAFQSGGDLLEAHGAAPFDALFLDICMPGLDGFEVAKAVRDKSDLTSIIFITVKEELVYDSFDFRPFNFIRKEPGALAERRVADIIEKLLRHRKQHKDFVLEPALSEKTVVSVKDIVHITSDRNYLEYVLADGGKVSARGTLREAWERFEGYDFIKIQKGVLVNMRHIEKISYPDCKITLANGDAVYMGRAYKKSIDEKYTSYQRSLR